MPKVSGARLGRNGVRGVRGASDSNWRMTDHSETTEKGKWVQKAKLAAAAASANSHIKWIPAAHSSSTTGHEQCTTSNKAKWIQAAEVAAKAHQQTRVTLPPSPCLDSSPLLGITQPRPVDPNDFVQVMRLMPLPSSLAFGGWMLDDFSTAVLGSVESFYRDRLEPTVGDVQKRLRSSGWGFAEVRAVLPLCARNLSTYELTPPSTNSPVLILLRHRPEWFNGFIDADSDQCTYSNSVWAELRKIIGDLDQKQPGFSFPGGLCELATALQKSKVAPTLSALSLGELRNVLTLAFGPRHQLLAFDASHGGRLKKIDMLDSVSSPCTPPPSGNKSSATSTEISHVATPARSAKVGSSGKISRQPSTVEVSKEETSAQPIEPDDVEELILEMLRQRPLPPGLGRGCGPQTRSRCRILRSCIYSLYRDRIRPTLGEVQQRLLDRGWTFQDVQGVLPLCARESVEYTIQMPSDGQPVCVLLRDPPSWFEGWVSELPDGSNLAEPDVLECFATFLKDEGPTLSGSIHGAAENLRQRSLPPLLQQLTLGEWREVVTRAVEDHGLLSFSDNGLRANAVVLNGDDPGDNSPRQRTYTVI